GNFGTNPTDRERWADAVWLSTDDDLHDNQGEQWLVFAIPHIGGLNPGDDYTQEVTFTLPPSARGSHFIIETNVDPRIALTNEESLLDQVQAIMQRAEQILGAPLLEVPISQVSQLTANDVLFILTGDGG